MECGQSFSPSHSTSFPSRLVVSSEMGFLALFAMLGVIIGTPPDTVGGEDTVNETSDGNREMETSEDRERRIIKIMKKLSDAEEKVKEAVAVRDQILGELIQERYLRGQFGEETSFSELPGEILSMIISNLPFQDRLFSRVSKRLFDIEKNSPPPRHLDDTELELTVEFLPRDEIKITTLILMEEEWDDIIKEIYLPFHSAFSLINTKIRTMKLKGVRLINMGNLRIDQMEQLCELIPFLSVKEFIDVNNCFNEELKVSFEVRRFIEILKRNKNLLRFDFTAATINVTAEQLMEIRRIHSMLNLRGFAIRIECCEIDEIVSSIFGLEIVRDGWITREMMESGLLTTQRQADILVSPERSTSSPPSLFRRELEETGEEGRMVTRIDRDEKNPMIYEYFIGYFKNGSSFSAYPYWSQLIPIPHFPSLPF